MEFIVVFLVCLLVLVILVAGISFGRAPVYRPERGYVLTLLKGINEGSVTEQEWALFINTPITHDEELEKIRWRCCQFDEGLSEFGPSHPGISGYLYNRAGREYIKQIEKELDALIRDQPLTLDF